MLNKIYLDHAATTPLHPTVIHVMKEALTQDYGNASSVYYLGRESRNKLDLARTVFAKSIHSKASEIIFTSGGTESDNTAIIKMAESLKGKGQHIITSAIEHHAVLHPIKYLEERGFEVTILPVDQRGLINLDALKESLRDDTILVSIMFANNEVGTIQPIEEIGRVVKKQSNAVFHTDAVQAYGSLPIDVRKMNIDLLSVSAHKLNGPKGVGFLYKREDLFLPSLLMGGQQENKNRAGTENVPAIVGFQRAVELKCENHQVDEEHLKNLRKHFITLLNDYEIEYEVNGHPDQSLPHILNLSFKDVPSEKLLIQLDLQGIMAAAGSACTAGTLEPSHVLEAMYGQGAPQVESSVRFSFGPSTSREEINQTVNVLSQALEHLKERSK